MEESFWKSLWTCRLTDNWWWYIYIYIYIFVLARHPPPQWAMVSSFTRFLDHTKRRTTVGRVPLDEWSALRKDLYLTTRTTITTDRHPRPRWDSNPQSSAGERPQIYALDRARTGTGNGNVQILISCFPLLRITKDAGFLSMILIGNISTFFSIIRALYRYVLPGFTFVTGSSPSYVFDKELLGTTENVSLLTSLWAQFLRRAENSSSWLCYKLQ